MNLKKTIVMLMIIFAMSITKVNAEETINDNSSNLNTDEVEVTKYYKTVTALNNSSMMRNANLGELTSFTTEVTEEEYNEAPTDEELAIGISPRSTSIETTYKRLTTKMSKYSDTFYKYDATLIWKNIPSTRSYDIMGIGYYASVTIANTPTFKETYCTSDGLCNTTYSCYYKNGNNGTGVMFHLPSGSLSSLTQNLNFLVKKTHPDLDLYEQTAVGDYSHATKEISYNAAKDFSVNTGGIFLDANYYSYDTTPEAVVVWKGTW